MKTFALVFGYFVATVWIAAILIDLLGWHWLAFYPVFCVAFFVLGVVAFLIADAWNAFAAGFKRGGGK